MPAVEPHVNKRFAEVGFGLGNFVLMMRKDVVHTTAVDIKIFTQVFGTHHRTFNVPARSTLTDLCVPGRFSLLFVLPEGKILGMFLFILIRFYPESGPEFGAVNL